MGEDVEQANSPIIVAAGGKKTTNTNRSLVIIEANYSENSINPNLNVEDKEEQSLRYLESESGNKPKSLFLKEEEVKEQNQNLIEDNLGPELKMQSIRNNVIIYNREIKELSLDRENSNNIIVTNPSINENQQKDYDLDSENNSKRRLNRYNSFKPNNLATEENAKTTPIKLKSLKDLEELSIMERLKYDPRSLWEYFKENVSDEHVVLNLFLKKSLFIPVQYRVLRTVSLTALMFLLNALLYTDDNIERIRGIQKSSDVVIYLKYRDR